MRACVRACVRAIKEEHFRHVRYKTFLVAHLHGQVFVANMLTKVSPDALRTRRDQGWLLEDADDLDDVINRIRKYRRERKAVSIGYCGNVVDLW